MTRKIALVGFSNSIADSMRLLQPSSDIVEVKGNYESLVKSRKTLRASNLIFFNQNPNIYVPNALMLEYDSYKLVNDKKYETPLPVVLSHENAIKHINKKFIVHMNSFLFDILGKKDKQIIFFALPTMKDYSPAIVKKEFEKIINIKSASYTKLSKEERAFWGYHIFRLLFSMPASKNFLKPNTKEIALSCKLPIKKYSSEDTLNSIRTDNADESLLFKQQPYIKVCELLEEPTDHPSAIIARTELTTLEEEVLQFYPNEYFEGNRLKDIDNMKVDQDILSTEIALIPSYEVEEDIIQTMLPFFYTNSKSFSISNFNDRYKIQTGNESPFIGEHPILELLFKDIEKASRNKWGHVLIVGETGSGKELVAEMVRRLCFPNKELKSTNAALLINEKMAQSQLFGRVKGGYTGATSDRPGLIQEAHNNALFIDEIQALPEGTCNMLLRFMETGDYNRVGDEKTSHATVKIVVATNVDDYTTNPKLNQSGFIPRFSHIIRVPSIRYRESDIKLLLEHFFETSKNEYLSSNAKQGKKFNQLVNAISFPKYLVERCENISWKNDNVRGLRTEVTAWFYNEIANIQLNLPAIPVRRTKNKPPKISDIELAGLIKKRNQNSEQLFKDIQNAAKRQSYKPIYATLGALRKRISDIKDLKLRRELYGYFKKNGKFVEYGKKDEKAENKPKSTPLVSNPHMSENWKPDETRNGNQNEKSNIDDDYYDYDSDGNAI